MKPLSRTERERLAGSPDGQLDLPKFLPYRLSVVAEQMSRLIAKTYADRFGLSIPEWRVIAHLGRSAGLSARAIGQQTAMDKVKVSRAVTRLTSRRLVRREVNPLDQRAVLLALTPAGRTVYESVVPAALAMERAICSKLDPADVAHFTRTLDRLEAQIVSLASAAEVEPTTVKVKKRSAESTLRTPRRQRRTSS